MTIKPSSTVVEIRPNTLPSRPKQASETPSSWLEERTWIRAMIDQVPDYLFVKDIDCRFVVANRAVAADLGHGDPAAILGKTDLELHPPSVAEGFYQNDKAVMASGLPLLDIEEFVVLQDGSKRWLSTSKLPLKSETGTIIGLIGIARDITERKRAEDQVRHLAYFDTLTGLPNRANFERMLADTVESMPDGAEGALLFIDLDGFKFVNDALGHLAGDDLLRQAGARLSQLVGDGDLVARLGGDEFAIIVAKESEELAAFTLCEFVLAVLKEAFQLNGEVAHIGASIGVAKISRTSELEQVLREADIALYEAKGKGRGRWQSFEGAMALSLAARRRLEGDLRAALASPDQLQLFFQPIYAVTGAQIVGAEALIRWAHPTRGMVPPGEFIDIAEEKGLIEELGRWVLGRACSQIKQTDVPWVAVNVSPIQLRRPGFAAQVLEILAGEGLPPTRLQLEITEGVLIENPTVAAKELRQLRAAGVKLSIDDFGTGYSSLNYLQRYEVDKLKIDRSFVAKLGTSKGADAIVSSTIHLARAFNMTVTAEGVETAEQQRLLAGLGCDDLQGFYLARPMPFDELLTLTMK